MPKNFAPLALTNGLLVLLLLLASSCSKTDEDSTAQSNEMVAPPAATDLASPQGHPLDASAPPLITQVQAAKAAADLPIDHLPFAKVNPSYKYENQLVLARDSFVIDERNPALSGREYFLQFYLLNETDLSYYTAFRGMVVKFAYHEKPNGEGEVKIITYDDLDPSLVGMHLGITPLKPVAHWQTIPHPKSRKQVVGTCFGGSDNLYNRLLRSSFIPGKVDRIRDLYTCSPDFTAQTNLTTQEILIEGTMQINHGPVAENKLALRSLDVMRYVIVLTPYQRENALIPHNFSKKEDPYYLCGDTVYSNANGGYVNYTLKRNLARAPFYYYFAPHFPQQYKQAVADAFTYWNNVFGKKVVILAGELPADDRQALNTLALANNIIQWDARPYAKLGAYSTLAHDPANGEILKNIITLHLDDIEQNIPFIIDYYRHKRLQDLPLYPFGPSALAAIEDLTPAKKQNELQQVFAKVIEEKMIEQIKADHFRETVAHELGHSFGLGHNFAGNNGGTLTPEKVFPLMNTYLTLLTGKFITIADDLQPTEEELANLRETLPGSSVMDYYGDESDILLGHRIRVLAQETREQIPARERIAYLPYDKAAIDRAYNDLTDPITYPYCDDDDVERNFIDCRRHDQFNHPIDFHLWKAQRDWLFITHTAAQIDRSSDFLRASFLELLNPLAEIGEVLRRENVFLFPHNPHLYEEDTPAPSLYPDHQALKEARLKHHHIDLAQIFLAPVVPQNSLRPLPLMRYWHALMGLWAPHSATTEAFFQRFKFPSSPFFSAEHPVFSGSEFAAYLAETPAAPPEESPDPVAEEVPPTDTPELDDATPETPPASPEDTLAFRGPAGQRNLWRQAADGMKEVTQKLWDDELQLLSIIQERLITAPLTGLYLAWMLLIKDLQFEGFNPLDYSNWTAFLTKFAKTVLWAPSSLSLPLTLAEPAPVNAYFPNYPLFLLNHYYNQHLLPDILRNLMVDLLWHDYFLQPAYTLQAGRSIAQTLLESYQIILPYLDLLESNLASSNEEAPGMLKLKSFLEQEKNLFLRLRTLPNGSLLPFTPLPLPEAAPDDPPAESPAENGDAPAPESAAEVGPTDPTDL